jgi:hypothetical protein
MCYSNCLLRILVLLVNENPVLSNSDVINILLKNIDVREFGVWEDLEISITIARQLILLFF